MVLPQPRSEHDELLQGTPARSPSSRNRYPVMASVAYRWLALCLMTTPAPSPGRCPGSCLSA